MQIELVERARAGDHDAFSVLVRASSPRLYGTAKLILRDPDRAQDAVQEALVLAWRQVRGSSRSPSRRFPMFGRPVVIRDRPADVAPAAGRG